MFRTVEERNKKRDRELFEAAADDGITQPFPIGEEQSTDGEPGDEDYDEFAISTARQSKPEVIQIGTFDALP